jgi:phosphatidylglycerol:prolipoprotein diacylglycerol transferase
MHPVLFHVGRYTFYSFGLMAALALIVPSLTVLWPLLKRRGVNPDFALELLFAAGIGGFAGARVYYLIQQWPDVRHHLLHSAFSGIGFTWYGGLIGGALLVVVWTLVRRVPVGIVANAMGPGVAMGYAIGRIGCQLAGDGDYGKPTHLSWVLAMGYPHGTVPTPPGVNVFPTPIYEIVLMAPIVWVLYRIAMGKRSGWLTFGWFLVLSGVERFFIELIRRNPVWFWGLRQPQVIAIVGFVIGTVLIARFRQRPAELLRSAGR